MTVWRVLVAGAIVGAVAAFVMLQPGDAPNHIAQLAGGALGGMALAYLVAKVAGWLR